MHSYFFRLDATQAAIAVGFFEIVTLLHVYLAMGLGYGASVLEFKDPTAILNATEGCNPSLVSAIKDNISTTGLEIPVLTIIFFILLLFPTMLTIGTVKGIRGLMVPWIILAIIRVLIVVFMIFLTPGLPFASWAQFYYIIWVSFLLIVTVYSLVAVCDSYSVKIFRNPGRLTPLSETERANIQYRSF